MAQVLKEETRQKIVEAAGNEFLEHGCEDSSMRRIAFHCNMTVGNLYRYFKNKEQLIFSAVFPAYKEIDDLVKELTHGQLSLEETEFHDLTLTGEELKHMISRLCSGLLSTYQRHRKATQILMMRSDVNERITAWFAAVIKALIASAWSLPEDDRQLAILSRGYAVSIFSGIREMMITSENDDDLPRTVEIYLHSFVTLLENKDLHITGESL